MLINMTAISEAMNRDEQLRASFGARLKELRKQHKLTQKELAAKLGVRHTHLNKYESGLHAPPFGKLMMIAEIFGVSIDFLLTGEAGDATGIANSRLLRRFQEVQNFDPDDQETVLKLLDAMVAKQRMAGAMQPLD
jgi:transcriptional regulator with XRE-family HTH domain